MIYVHGGRCCAIDFNSECLAIVPSLPATEWMVPAEASIQVYGSGSYKYNPAEAPGPNRI